MATTTILSQAELEALLGRPLTQTEVTNLDLYLEIAQEQLEGLLGLKITGEANSARVYEARAGYHSLVVDPFSNKTPTVTDADGNAVTGYKVRLDDDYNAAWFNTIEFDDLMQSGSFTVAATWGYGTELPKGLKLLLAVMFDVVSSGQTVAAAGQVKSESVLSHSVTFDTSKEALDRFADANAALLRKYRNPLDGLVRSGEVG